MSSQPGRYQRSVPGMVGAMLVLVLVVGAFVTLREVYRDEPANPVRAVDYTKPAEYARGEAEFDLMAPATVPKGWMATNVRFVNGRDQSWHLSFLTEEGRYVGLKQQDQSADGMVEEFVDEEAEQGEDVVIRGQTWQSWSDPGGDLALVREGRDVTTLVLGTASPDVLEEFVRSLR